MLIHEEQETKYVIKVRGRIVSIPFTSYTVAEQQIKNLSPQDQIIAEVAAVTPEGKELLFG